MKTYFFFRFKMGLTISSLFGRLFGKKQMRILMGKVNDLRHHPSLQGYIYILQNAMAQGEKNEELTFRKIKRGKEKWRKLHQRRD